MRRVLQRPLLFVVVNITCKALLIGFGLPHLYNPDEPYILKDPFKLTLGYQSGNFASPTNLFFLVVQGWYALVFAVGRLVGWWSGFSGFSEALVLERPVLFAAGRTLGVVLSAAGIYLFCRVAARSMTDRRALPLVMLCLALNPIEILSTVWLKFDGIVVLFTGVLVTLLVRAYPPGERADAPESHAASDKARWRLYLLAVVGCSLRPDLAVFLVGLILFDRFRHRPFRPVLGALALGLGLWAVITLWPAVWLLGSAARGAPAVAATFEGNIVRNLLKTPPAALLSLVVRNIGAYLGVALSVAPLALVPLLRRRSAGTARERDLPRLLLVTAALLVIPVLLYPAGGSRYLLLPSLLATLAAAWAAPPRWLWGVMALWFASGSLEAIWIVRNQPDIRRDAARFLLERTRPAETIAIQGYMNQGRRPELAECPQDLLAKADAIQRHGKGTGETLRARARHPTVPERDCRRILEVATFDLFAGTALAGRWYSVYQPIDTRFFASRVVRESLRESPLRQQLKADFVEAARFESHYRDPRLRWLLPGSAYHLNVYVYQARSGQAPPPAR